MTSKSKILVPVDFSEQSLIALRQSFNLARFTESEILLLHVIDEDFLCTLSSYFKDQPYEDPMRDQIQVKLDALANEIQKESGIVIQTAIRKGKIYEEIVKTSHEIEAKFIIMGTHGSVGIKKKFIGSNAMRVIKEASCPVITIKGTEHHRGCKKIVLPLDLSKETKEKVGKAIEIANFFNSEIHVISVVESDDEFVINKLKRQLNQVINIIKDQEIKVISEIINASDVPAAILDYSKKADADLIIIMTQQEIYWTELFIGFAAQEIINSSDIPVLSIRPTLKSKIEFVLS